MNDNDLKTMLRRMEVPEPTPEGRLVALRRAQRAFAESAPEPVRWWRGRRTLLAAGTLAMCAIIIALAPARRGDTPLGDQPAPWSGVVAAQQKLFRETLAVFPNELRAVVSNEAGPHVVLSEAPSVTSGEPVVLEIRKDGHTVRLATFGGERIEIRLGERQQSIEVLVSGSGEVQVVGPDFYWSPAKKLLPADMSVNASVMRM